MNNSFSACFKPNFFTDKNFQPPVYDSPFGLGKRHDSEGQLRSGTTTPTQSILPRNINSVNEHIFSLLPESDSPQWISSFSIKPSLDGVDSGPFNLTDIEYPLVNKQEFQAHQRICMCLPGYGCMQELLVPPCNTPFRGSSLEAPSPFISFQDFQVALGSNYEENPAYLPSNLLTDKTFFGVLSPPLLPDCQELRIYRPSPLPGCNCGHCVYSTLSVNNTLSQCDSTELPTQPPLLGRQDSQKIIRSHGSPRSMPFSGDKGRILTLSEVLSESTSPQIKPKITIPELSPFLIAPKSVRYRRMLELNLDVCKRLWNKMEMDGHGRFSVPSTFELQGSPSVLSPLSPVSCDWYFDSAGNIHI